MIWLQSNEQFNDVAELDERTGNWWLASRASGNTKDIPSCTSGFYSILSDVFCAIFRSNGELFVRVGETQVRLSGDIELTVEGPPAKRCLSLMVSGLQLARHVYSLETESFEGDTTPFVEDEDFDFGIFLSNIASSPNRQAVLKGDA